MHVDIRLRNSVNCKGNVVELVISFSVLNNLFGLKILKLLIVLQVVIENEIMLLV